MSLRYESGELIFGKSVRLPELAQKFPTPFYIYDLDGIEERLKLFRSAFTIPVEPHFAMKANAHPQILRLFQKNGIGADVVSGGEIQNALAAGFAGEKIIFSGVGKTIAEIDLALQSGIRQINVESAQELIRIGERAKALGKIAPVALRMNPDVDAQTHPYITTGFHENKFGLDISQLPELLEICRRYSTSLRLQGLTLHIGSQLLDLAPMRAAIEKVIPIFKDLRAQGHPLTTFDAGGGLGIDYTDMAHAQEDALIHSYGKMVSELLAPLGAQVLLEPGRILVAPFGVLVAEVQYVKTTPHKNFLITNTGIHHLLRPALYQAFHGIYPLENSQLAKKEYDIVGPICESSDIIGKKRLLPEVKQGEALAIADVGAYGFTMATVYNEHQLPLQLIIRQGKVSEA